MQPPPEESGICKRSASRADPALPDHEGGRLASPRRANEQCPVSNSSQSFARLTSRPGIKTDHHPSSSSTAKKRAKLPHYSSRPFVCSLALLTATGWEDAQVRCPTSGGAANGPCHGCTKALFVRSLCPLGRTGPRSLPTLTMPYRRSCEADAGHGLAGRGRGEWLKPPSFIDAKLCSNPAPAQQPPSSRHSDSSGEARRRQGPASGQRR